MKTSNIIVLGVFGSILIWIFIVFFITMQRVKSEVSYEKQIHSERVNSIAKPVDVESFHSIILSGKGELTVQQTGNYSYRTAKENNNVMKIGNDTLYLKLSDERNRIEVKSLRSIVVKDDARFMFSDCKEDTLSIYSYGNGNLIISSLEVSDLQIFAKDSSSVYLYEVAGKNAADAEFVLQDKSRLIIGTMTGLSVDLKKSPESEYVCR